MVIEIEVDQDVMELIRQRVESGAFRNASEVVAHAIRSSFGMQRQPSVSRTGLTGADPIAALQASPHRDVELELPVRKSLAELFSESPFQGEDLEFSRDKEAMRSIDL